MPKKINKPLLRNTLKKLRRVPFDRSEPTNAAMAPQEMLDFLAMLAGIKPVCLVGRGFDDPNWVAGVEALAGEMKLHIVRGPQWHAEPKLAGLPAWYAEEDRNPTEGSVVYICKSRSVAAELREVCASAAIIVDQEARLLGYAPCCVRDHYRRDRMFDEAFTLMLRRTARGDEKEMRRIVREAVKMSVETEQEQALMEEATDRRPARFTSVNMCRLCADDRDSPAAQMSHQYEALAHAVDPRLASEIRRIEMHYDALER